MMNNYQADSIESLNYFEHIRRYPGMYIGSKDLNGLHHCIKEIISNSIDEFLNGAGSEIIIEIQSDGGIYIKDNGRGIPHGKHESGCSILQACYGIANTGGKFNNATGQTGYNTSGGEHGTGGKAVNALSRKMIVTTSREGYKEVVEFSKGQFIYYKQEPTKEHGTEVLFYPDKEIFETTKVDVQKLENMIQEFSFLCSGLTFKYIVEGKEKVFYSDNGLYDYLNYLNGNKELLINPIYLQGQESSYQVECIIGYNNSYSSVVKMYTNNIPQEKGTHLTGFKTAWTSTLNNYARENKILKDKDDNLTGADLEEGQILIINFKMIDPVFKGQNKEELSSSEGRTYVQRLVSESLKNYLQSKPKDINVILNKAINARKAREAAKKAREAVRENKKARKKKIINPDKLKDAEQLGQDSVLLCVEGLSAASSMAVARDIKRYGILALRGKPLNLYTNNQDRINKNEEMQLLINALGIDLAYYDNSQLRYGKVAIASDSDSDGYHIGLLIAVALEHLCPQFLEEGRLCWLRSPLYIVKEGKKESYYYSDEELVNANINTSNKIVQRNKGLGSLSAEQAHNSMFTKEFQRLDVLQSTPEAVQLLRDLMGNSAVKRKDFIFKNVDFSEIKE